MSRIVAQLLLSIIAMLAAPMIFCTVVLLGGISHGDDRVVFPTATIATVVVSAAIWLLLWGRHLRWTGRRRGQTIGVALGSVALGAVVGITLEALSRENELGCVFGTMVWVIFWYGGTTLVWRETAFERAERIKLMGAGAVACPVCGYNLTGLREATCPECGTRFTLDQLLASMNEQRQPLDE